jgi:hypothetical protein
MASCLSLGFCLRVGRRAWCQAFRARRIDPSLGANPPASFSLLPYGPRGPFNPGDFFQPLSALLVIGTLGALLTGWRTSRTYRAWLWASLITLLAIWLATPTLFWPMIRDLYAASTGSRPLTEAAAQSLAAQWIAYDWIRAAFIAVGFVCVVRAISTIHRAYAA